jgi:hypothetical protein
VLVEVESDELLLTLDCCSVGCVMFHCVICSLSSLQLYDEEGALLVIAAVRSESA